MLGLLVALIGITLTHVTGIVYFDGTASILIGFILIGTAIWLARETKSLLIGESADPQIVQGIHEIVKDESIVEHVNEILRVRAKISLHFRRMDLGQIFSIRGCKTTGIASYFEDFGVEDRTKMA